MLGLCLQRNWIAVVGPNGLHAGNPQSYLHLVAYRAGKVQITALLDDAAIGLFWGREIDCPGPKQRITLEKSAVAQAVRRTLPLRDIVGDHAGRFHRRLAELGIAGNLALNALTFGMQDIAQALKL
jgi:hypothetical protein